MSEADEGVHGTWQKRGHAANILLNQELGRLWKELPEEAKLPYQERQAQDIARFHVVRCNGEVCGRPFLCV